MISRHNREYALASINADPYNKNNMRTVKNTNYHAYNCGGYALGTMSWYSFGYDQGYFFYSREQNLKKIEDCAEILLNEFNDLRRIYSLNEVGKDEYAIALRITSNPFDDDFHFLKCGKNGQWYQKRGSCKGIERIPQEEVFSSNWSGRYVGIIALFAKKLPKNT